MEPWEDRKLINNIIKNNKVPINPDWLPENHPRGVPNYVKDFWEKKEVEWYKHLDETQIWSPADGGNISKGEFIKTYGEFLYYYCEGLEDWKGTGLPQLMKSIKRGEMLPIETKEDFEYWEKGRPKKSNVDETTKLKRQLAAQKAQKTKAINQMKKEQLTGRAAEMKEEMYKNNPLSELITEEEPELEMCDPKQYLKVPYALLQSDKWRHLKGLEAMVLLELMKRVVSSKKQRDSYGLYKNFYEKGYLACCVKQRELAQWFGISQQRVSNITNALEKKGCIQKHTNPKFKNTQVFVVGTTTNGCKHYYV